MSHLPPDALPALAHALAQSSTCRYLGLRAEATGAGIVVVLPAHDRHVGDSIRRSLHGGVLAAYLEAASGAVLAAHRDGVVPVTISFATAFVRPAVVADTYAAIDIVRTGRRIAHVRADAWQGEPTDLVSIGQGTFSTGT